jgi:mRNA deadenylase 3'-5' endonuclease subunit Ccr4
MLAVAQEVESSYYTKLLQPDLEKLGYQGTFQKKGKLQADGVATFFHTG